MQYAHIKATLSQAYARKQLFTNPAAMLANFASGTLVSDYHADFEELGKVRFGF